MISIIIPVYNSEATLEVCLKHIFLQTYTDYEVIVVDDGSIDNSKEIAKKFSCKLIESDKNNGAAAARNRGVKEAKGEIVCFTDSDCLVPEDWLEKISKNFENRNIGAVGGGYAYSAGKSEIEKFAFLELAYRRKDFPEYVSCAVSNNLACRKEIFEKLGGFPEYFKGAGMEEIVFTYALSKKYKIVWDKENGVGHYFYNKLLDYLKQQYTFAFRAALVTVFVPSISSVEIFKHKKKFYQLLSFLFSVFLLIIFLFLFENNSILFIILLMILSLLLTSFHYNFFYKDFFSFISLKYKKISYKDFEFEQYMGFRNIVWIIGFVCGTVTGFYRKNKDLSKVWLETYK